MADGGFAGAYGVELLMEEAPQIDKAKLLAALRRHETVDALDEEDPDFLGFEYPEHKVQYEDRTIPPQLLVSITERPLDVERIHPAVEQSWDWPDAREAVARCRATILVADFFSSNLEYQTRLRLFHHSLLAVLEQINCIGIHWQPSQRIVDPQAYIKSKQNDEDEIFPAINVRMFRVENGQPGETLMDTLGLAALGLPDIQCHFFAMDSQEVARVLFNTGYYLFKQSDVIQDGHTVQGLNESQKWKCQHEDALVGPERVVLDLDAGAFAAGNRDRG